MKRTGSVDCYVTIAISALGTFEMTRDFSVPQSNISRSIGECKMVDVLAPIQAAEGSNPPVAPPPAPPAAPEKGSPEWLVQQIEQLQEKMDRIIKRFM